jgi:hypothetical protein
MAARRRQQTAPERLSTTPGLPFPRPRPPPRQLARGGGGAESRPRPAQRLVACSVSAGGYTPPSAHGSRRATARRARPLQPCVLPARSGAAPARPSAAPLCPRPPPRGLDARGSWGRRPEPGDRWLSARNRGAGAAPGGPEHSDVAPPVSPDTGGPLGGRSRGRGGARPDPRHRGARARLGGTCTGFPSPAAVGRRRAPPSAVPAGALAPRAPASAVGRCDNRRATAVAGTG